MKREQEVPVEFSGESSSIISAPLSDTLTCRQVGGRRAARLVAVIFPAGLVRGPNRAAVPVALLHRPGAGLPLTLHQRLTATHLLQEALLNVL